MTEASVAERDRLSFNSVVYLMVESLDRACLLLEEGCPFLIPVLILLLVLLFEVRVERFWLEPSSDQCSSASAHKQFVLELLLLDVLCGVHRLDAVSFKLVLG